MVSLTLIDAAGGGKALRLKNNALVLSATEPCCCGEYTIEICNSNSVTDDDWRVELNDKTLGTHSAPLNILAGTVWRTNSQIQVGCGTVTYYDLSKDDFVAGANNLKMTITKLYECGGGAFAGFGCGNFGTVTVRKWEFNNAQNAFVATANLLSSTYTGNSQLGIVNTFNFNYP
jgi:hypothetical protein